MPNYKVFQDVPASLRTRLYGVDDGTDVALVVNTAGVLAIQDNDASITVDATNLDIRDLVNTSDSVQIYGYDGTVNRAILTDDTGRLQITAITSFAEATQTVSTTTAFTGSTGRDVSLVPDYTWFVHNTGAVNSADVQLEISPNNVDWVIDGAVKIVPADTAVVVVPSIFLRYTRISYKSTVPAADTTLVLIWQAHN
jgi:hypothetical protein